MAMGAKLQLEPGSLMETLYDIYIGIVVGANHSFYIVSRWWYLNLFRPILLAFGIDWGVFEAKTAAAGTKETLKVVAVGYGRTGTVRGARRIVSVGVTDDKPKNAFGVLWVFIVKPKTSYDVL
jgi:hypothetical protein